MAERLRVEILRPAPERYAYLLIDERERSATAVDPGDGRLALEAARREGVHLVAVLVTGASPQAAPSEELLARAGPLRVFGAAADAERIPGLTDALGDGDAVRLGRFRAVARLASEAPGEPVVYYFGSEKTAFSGEALAPLASDVASSVERARARADRIAALPEETLVYASAEATVAALELALALEPENRAASDKLAWARSRIAQGRSTVPTTVGAERATNPLVRLAPELLRARLAALAGERERLALV